MSPEGKNMTPMKREFHLDKANGKLMGVCSGLANWSGIDATILRVVFALATIFGFGSALLLYLIIGFVAD